MKGIAEQVQLCLYFTFKNLPPYPILHDATFIQLLYNFYATNSRIKVA